ncbi:MAG: polysaccharide biosynthesis tyrosine autokinase [Hyphomicrobiales bacterium]
MTQHDPRMSSPPVLTVGRPNDTGPTAGIGELFSILLRGKWIIVAFTVSTMLFTLYYIYGLSVPKYKATTVVMLETQRGSIIDVQSVVNGLSGERSSVNSEVEVLRARSLMTEVVERLGLVSDPEFNARLRKPDPLSTLLKTLEAALGQSRESISTSRDQNQREQDSVTNVLLTKVTVRNVPSTLVFKITAETANPAKSALISDTIAGLYILNQVQVKFAATEQATDWLANRVSELQVQLEEAESRLAIFSASTDLVSVESLQGLERQLKDLRGRIETSRATETAAETRLAALQGATTLIQKATAADDAMLDQILAGTDTGLIAPVGFNDRYDGILSQAGLTARRTKLQLDVLSTSESALENEIRRQGEGLIAIQQLKREAEANRLLYEYFLGRLKEASAQQGIQQADSRILSKAVIPNRASSPPKSLLICLAVLSGLTFGSAFVLFLESRDVCFRTAQHLEEYAGLPVLGQIPTIPKKNRKKILTFLCDHPSSAGAEALRNLRTSTLLSNVDKPPQVIVLTSPMPGEGKTTVSLSFAQTLSGMGKKVLLIEGDVRRRMFHQYFDDVPAEGLISVLMGTRSIENAICRIPGFSTDVLIAERATTNAADLFSSGKFSELIYELKSRYDIIVIDTPPVLAVPDARIIAQQADAVLVNVKWNSTSKLQVDETLRLFRCGNKKISGFILNQICIKGMKRYGYGGRYGTYAAYETEYLAA